MSNTKKYRSKNIRVSELLLAHITDGLYPSGSRLPSCRQLAEEFKISKVTAAEALKNVVESGAALNRGNHGIFVAPPANGPLSVRKVVLFVPEVDSSFVPDFFHAGERVLGDHWQIEKYITAPSPESPELIRAFNDPETFMVFFHYPTGVLLDFYHEIARRRLERRCAFFGKRCEQYGIACFTGDELEIMRIAFGRLHERGRREIALITFGNTGVDAERLAVLRRFYPEDWRDRVLDFHLAENRDLEKTWLGLLDSGRLEKFDAVICGNPLSAACGHRVLSNAGLTPKKLELFSIGNAFFLRLVKPGIEALDTNLEGHFVALRSLIREREAGRGFEPAFFLCPPHLIPGDDTVFGD